MNTPPKRQFHQQEQANKRISFCSKEELERMLEEGIKGLDAGKGIPGKVALKSLRERASARRHARG